MKVEEKILTLILKKKWFEMISSGKKTEEYREIKPYWLARLYPEEIIKHYDRVKFYLGYQKDRASMTFKMQDIIIGQGKTEWGAENGKEYFVIKLGEKVEE